MSDNLVADPIPAAIPAAQNLTAGALLRQARESAGLHVAALAVSMKVPVKKLEALEADRLDLLPDAVFVRALASSVCRALKIDAVPILKLLPQTTTPKLDTEDRGINTPFHAAGDFKGRSWPAFISRPAVLWVFALLLGVVAVVVFPESRLSSNAAPATSAVGSKDASLESPKDSGASTASGSLTTDVSREQSVAIATPLVIPSAVTAAPPVAAPSLPSAATPAPVASSVVPTTLSVAQVAVPISAASAATPVAAAPTSGTVAFKVKGASWVEVTDAKGIVQLRRLLNVGEVGYASGAMPLSVVVGRVDMTQVEVRGQAFSLDPYNKDNVARFEVK